MSVHVRTASVAALLVGLLLSVAQIGMVACTMMLCLASRDFDLSVGSTIAFAGVLGAMVLERTGSVGLAIGGGLLAGAVERSNVDIAEELVGLITAQRNFQANAKAIDTATQISQTVINLRT